jgi:uracil-DNA glycosylase family 4
MKEGSPAIADLLADIRGFLARERELFGETLLIDPPLRGDSTMIRSKPAPAAPADVPGLFELPVPAALPITGEPWGEAQSLDGLNALICTCVKCPLGHSRTNFVFGTGNPAATLMIIGEAPGADEDAQGEPFVGRAGQLLNKILEAIGFKRQDVYICNILKCRPPGNRKPLAEEVDLCIPYLRKQIALVKPKLILALGLTAAENLLGTTESLSRLRGRIMQYEGTPLMVTYHPAALLRNPNWKRPAWEDVQAVRKLHDELVAQGR